MWLTLNTCFPSERLEFPEVSAPQRVPTGQPPIKILGTGFCDRPSHTLSQLGAERITSARVTQLGDDSGACSCPPLGFPRAFSPCDSAVINKSQKNNYAPSPTVVLRVTGPGAVLRTPTWFCIKLKLGCCGYILCRHFFSL